MARGLFRVGVASTFSTLRIGLLLVLSWFRLMNPVAGRVAIYRVQQRRVRTNALLCVVLQLQLRPVLDDVGRQG